MDVEVTSIFTRKDPQILHNVHLIVDLMSSLGFSVVCKKERHNKP